MIRCCGSLRFIKKDGIFLSKNEEMKNDRNNNSSFDDHGDFLGSRYRRQLSLNRNTGDVEKEKYIVLRCNEKIVIKW